MNHLVKRSALLRTLQLGATGCPVASTEGAERHGLVISLPSVAFSYLGFASIYNRPSLLEQPFLSKNGMAFYVEVFNLPRASMCRSLASCMFGSPHLKKFRLLSIMASTTMIFLLPVMVPTSILRIEGQLTKPSAIYVPKLARRFALVFAAALQKLKREEEDHYLSPCIESVVLNDLLMTGSWKVDLQWHWATRSHINLLESHAYFGVLASPSDSWRWGSSLLSFARLPCCERLLMQKEGSSSKALMPSLRKSAALQICGGLYSALGFAPTRLNTADDPTRDAVLRESCSSSCISHLQPNVVQKLHALQVSRPTAGWIRLCFAPWTFPCERRFCSWSSRLLWTCLSLSMWILLGMVPICHCFPYRFGSSLSFLFASFLNFLCSATLAFACFQPLVLNLTTPKTPKEGLNPRGLGGKQSIIRSHCLLAVLSPRVGCAMFSSWNFCWSATCWAEDWDTAFHWQGFTTSDEKPEGCSFERFWRLDRSSFFWKQSFVFLRVIQSTQNGLRISLLATGVVFTMLAGHMGSTVRRSMRWLQRGGHFEGCWD